MAGPFDSLRVGETDHTGSKVQFVFGRSSYVAVYMIEGDALKLEAVSNTPTSREAAILKVFDSLYSLICLSLKRKTALGLKYELGSAVYRALADRTGAGAVEDYFSDISDRVRFHTLDFARFVYVVSGLLTAAVASIVLCARYDISPFKDFDNVSLTVLGTLGGIIGAALSIFIRSNDLQISPYKYRSLTAFQGASRIALGALFGFVFVCCVKAKILFGETLLGDPYALFAISILSGFSETFVPELLKRLETNSTAAAAKAKLPGSRVVQKVQLPQSKPTQQRKHRRKPKQEKEPKHQTGPGVHRLAA
jgi:hypothetical protein